MAQLLGNMTQPAQGPPQTLFLSASKRELEWLRGLSGKPSFRSERSGVPVEHLRSLAPPYGTWHCLHHWRVARAWDIMSQGLTTPWLRPLPYYYINLERSNERRKLQEDQAPVCGLRAVRVPGIEPPFTNDVFMAYGERMMQGVMDDGSDSQLSNAIVLSVLSALRTAVKDEAPFFILAEDDAMLLLQFHERLARVWRAAPNDCDGLCLHSTSLAIHTQLMDFMGTGHRPPPLVYREWPTYCDGHSWAPHEVICNEPLIFLLGHTVACKLLHMLEVHLQCFEWSPIDWILPELIKRNGLPIYLVNPNAMRLVGAPFVSDRHPPARVAHLLEANTEPGPVGINRDAEQPANSGVAVTPPQRSR